MELKELRPAGYNPRRISPEAMKGLSKSLSEFGDISGLVWNKRTGHLVAGHQRLAALKAQHGDGLLMDGDTLTTPTGERFPVRTVDWPESKERMANVAANNPHIAGQFDEGLEDILKQLEADDAALFEALRMEELRASDYAKPGLVDPDEVPAGDTVPRRAEPGSLFILGDHRLLCGDATNVEDVVRLLDGAKPFLCVTDPPYGVNYDPAWRNEAANAGLIAHAARRVGNVTNDNKSEWQAAYALFPGDVMYLWHASASAIQFAQNLMATGFEIRNQIIWAKPRFAISRGHYNWQHEPCWYAVRKGKTAAWKGDHSQTTLWEINLDKNVPGGHSTQKPVECMRKPLENHDLDACYDPFVGSGTTLIAAEQTGVRCYAMELNPAYVDVAVARWELFTGKTAVLQATPTVALEGTKN